MPLDDSKTLFRHAFISEIARLSETPLGRTAVMKIAYFSQTLKGIPLSYNFRIYNYGPYDGQVLEDLKVCEMLGGIVATPMSYTGRNGVAISSGENAEEVVSLASDEIREYVSSIEWVVSEFAKRTASDLEISSTIVFVDRSMGELREIDLSEIVSRVHTLKPHHSKERIGHEANKLAGKKLLCSVARYK